LWSKFNALLVANSIVLAALALNLTSEHPARYLTVPFAGAGVVLCIVWTQTTKRGFENYVYWIMSSRELEELYLSDPVKTVSRGGDFAEGRAVTLQISSRKKKMEMSRLGDGLRVQNASYILIGVFAALYLLIIAANWREQLPNYPPQRTPRLGAGLK
jgi:hypothetical protein